MDALRPLARVQHVISSVRPTRLLNGAAHENVHFYQSYRTTSYMSRIQLGSRPFSSCPVQRQDTQSSPSTRSENHIPQNDLTQRATSDSSTLAPSSENAIPGTSSTTAAKEAPWRVRRPLPRNTEPRTQLDYSILNNTTSRSTTGADPASFTRDPLADLFGPRDVDSPRGTAEKITREVSRNAHQDDEQRVRQKEDEVRLRLKPSLGRTKTIEQSVDLQTAIGHLESECKKNSVRLDERNQKIYVRRGQRRKNLKSLRWRRMFKAGFQQEVGRIQRMRRQGW